MTTAEAMRNDLAQFLVDEHSKEKQIQKQNYNHYEEEDNYTDTNQSAGYYINLMLSKLIFGVFYIIKKILYFLYVYIKTFIRMSLIFIWNIIKYIASLYRPTTDFIDNYFTKFLKTSLEIISNLSHSTSIKLYKYGKSKKYYKVEVGKRKYSDIDLARMASGIGDYEELTLKDIENRFTIGYDTAIKVRDMRNDGLRMLQLLKEALELEKNNNY